MKANKRLGQHFLTSSTVIEKITSNFEQDCDVIVEVGPGPGVLTKTLSTLNKPLFLLEKDTRFKPILDELTNPEKIFWGDALKFNWDEFIITNGLENKKVWLVSNLPYNVGTVLFTNFLQINCINFMTLMFQKEVGDKTYLREIKNQMNGLLFLTQNYFSSEKLIDVAPGCFSPPPKVESVVVSYERKTSPQVPTEDFPSLNSFTRVLFSQRRKQIGGILKNHFGAEKADLVFQSTQIDKVRRAETLSLEEVYNLYKNSVS